MYFWPRKQVDSLKTHCTPNEMLPWGLIPSQPCSGLVDGTMAIAFLVVSSEQKSLTDTYTQEMQINGRAVF